MGYDTKLISVKIALAVKCSYNTITYCFFYEIQHRIFKLRLMLEEEKERWCFFKKINKLVCDGCIKLFHLNLCLTLQIRHWTLSSHQEKGIKTVHQILSISWERNEVLDQTVNLIPIHNKIQRCSRASGSLRSSSSNTLLSCEGCSVAQKGIKTKGR